LGRAYLELRDLRKARRLLEQAKTNAHALHRKRMEVLALGSLVALEAMEGNLDAARRLLTAAMTLMRDERSTEEALICIVAAGDLEWAAGRQASALSIWRWVAASDDFDIPDRDLVRLKIDRALTQARELDCTSTADTVSLEDMLRQAERLSQG
jgi:hypothetical protein